MEVRKYLLKPSYCFANIYDNMISSVSQFCTNISHVFFQALHRETKQLAALKQVALEEEEDLETFMIEIDILAECKHKNVVELLEAYHYDGKLWVRYSSYLVYVCSYELI